VTELPPDLWGFEHAHVWHPYASLPAAVRPLPVASAHGVRIALDDGRELIDGMASWWSVIHGYNHPVLNAALREQVLRMAHVMFGGLTHRPAAELAALLVAITPEPMERVFFSDSGSVAVEVAIKMALQYWQSAGKASKRRLLTVRGGYHGDTFGAMSVCDPVTGMHQLFTGSLTQQLFAPRPECSHDLGWNDAYIAEFRNLLATHADEIAAVILEPIVQGAGGMRFYCPEYLRQVRGLCDEHAVLLILDEIATGFGRTGTLFACEQADVAPDILCLGKALTGGYLSLAATLTTAELAATISADNAAFMHGPTFMANPLACSLAAASVQLLLDSPWQNRLERIETLLREGLAPCSGLPSVREVRVLGGIGVVEMERPVDIAWAQPRLVAMGVWLRPFGRLLYTMPPYIIDETDLRCLTRAMVRLSEES